MLTLFTLAASVSVSRGLAVSEDAVHKVKHTLTSKVPAAHGICIRSPPTSVVREGQG